MTDIYLSTESLSKNYRETAANDKITVSLPRGKITGFIGRNGSGKTTMIRLLTGIAFPTSGRIDFADADARRHIGAIVESPTFFGGMTAAQNLVYQAKMTGADPGKSRELLESVGLDPASRKKVKNYSLGMRQRLGIAMALVGDPDLLILDEPTNGLDPQGMLEMRDLLHRLSREKNITILVSSHLLGELERIADSYIFIDKGRIVEQVDSAELEKRLTGSISVAFASDREELAKLMDECVRDGAVSSYEISDGRLFIYGPKNYRRLLTALGRAEITDLKTDSGTLENYYLDRVGE